MLKKQGIFIGGLLITVLAGCSSFESRKKATDNFDYLDASLAQPISTAGIGEVALDTTYNVPALGKGALPTYLGEQVDVRSPAQVLTVLEGTRTDDTAENTTVIFTAKDRGVAAKDDVWSLLLNFFAQHNVSAKNLDKLKGELVSDTFVFEQEFGSFFNTTDYRSEEQYKFTLKEPSSSRTASLAVELLSFKESVDGDVNTKPLLDAEKKRYEIGMINRLLVFALAENQRKNASLQSQDNRVPLDLGFDDNGLPAWVTKKNFDIVWAKLPLALAELNFEYESSNKNLGAYVMSFKQPSDSYWREKGVRGFELRRGSYTFQLGQSKNGETVITIFGRDKKPLSVQQVSKMYLSIVDLMQKHMRVENN
ncbi:outer membrane protein assembly factor BamC [Motilimonas sp. 1_MG-2023]|uniref:outer membrane protein assembly factor BamC n=2 Tax=Bacteria TaxID=2 RepID=UPI0026E2FF54|nr:outer membrane protein assembly factor BamC [Motilimonas sp. 1_MG-2023]MDO6525159.1 outer membrane protein assembly factor BamC [Motilimonas sp. 1_MG-2023]